MAKIFIRTNHGELIEVLDIKSKWNIDERYTEFRKLLLSIAITNAINIETTQDLENCACSPAIDEPCPWCEASDDYCERCKM